MIEIEIQDNTEKLIELLKSLKTIKQSQLKHSQEIVQKHLEALQQIDKQLNVLNGHEEILETKSSVTTKITGQNAKELLRHIRPSKIDDWIAVILYCTLDPLPIGEIADALEESGYRSKAKKLKNIIYGTTNRMHGEQLLQKKIGNNDQRTVYWELHPTGVRYVEKLMSYAGINSPKTEHQPVNSTVGRQILQILKKYKQLSGAEITRQLINNGHKPPASEIIQNLQQLEENENITKENRNGTIVYIAT